MLVLFIVLFALFGVFVIVIGAQCITISCTIIEMFPLDPILVEIKDCVAFISTSTVASTGARTKHILTKCVEWSKIITSYLVDYL